MKKSSIDRSRTGSDDGDSRRKTRRNLLSMISAAGAVGATRLPGQWTRPVVDHAFLPAHAQLSTPGPFPGPFTECQATCTQVATVLRTYDTNESPVLATTAITVAVTCARDPVGDMVSNSSSTSTSFTAELIATETSGITSFSISSSGSDLCNMDIGGLFTLTAGV